MVSSDAAIETLLGFAILLLGAAGPYLLEAVSTHDWTQLGMAAILAVMGGGAITLRWWLKRRR